MTHAGHFITDVGRLMTHAGHFITDVGRLRPVMVILSPTSVVKDR
jgi:hypothetical protein